MGTKPPDRLYRNERVEEGVEYGQNCCNANKCIHTHTHTERVDRNNDNVGGRETMCSGISVHPRAHTRKNPDMEIKRLQSQWCRAVVYCCTAIVQPSSIEHCTN